MADFKDRLREIRKEKGLTQQELGDAIGLHGMSISGYERGVKKPSFEALDNLAEALNVSIDYLLGSSDTNRPYPHHGDDLADRMDAYHRSILTAYDKASPDTQAAVRAILHLEG